ncbi:hypothetical protein TorRG33x02_006270 [Trema orientale]|uniref:Uncharacterized protein n=1 Tax=Trema orientale TaxID=63057 RepID=A0A2P5G076_TREOI|nr:hypothetical protein TorRG33x02_006270 [Trema orientale]
MKTNEYVNRIKRYYDDNFTEVMKEFIAKAKRAFDEGLEKIYDLVKLLKAKLWSGVKALKELASSLVKLIIGFIKGILSSFSNIMNEAGRIIKRKVVDLFQLEIMGELIKGVYFLAQGFLELIRMLQDKSIRNILYVCVVEAYGLLCKDSNKSIEEMMESERVYFKSLDKNERKAADFIYFALQLFF